MNLSKGFISESKAILMISVGYKKKVTCETEERVEKEDKIKRGLDENVQ